MFRARVILLCAGLAGCGGALSVESRPSLDGGDSWNDAAPGGGTTDATSGSAPSLPDEGGAPTDAGAGRDANEMLDAGPIVVGVVAPCLTGGNVIYVNGDPGDPVHPGPETFVYPGGGGGTSCGGGFTQGILSIGCPDELGATTSGFALAFGAADGSTLAPGVYSNALSSFAFDGNEPYERIEAFNDAGGSCPSYSIGRFQVEQLELDSNDDLVRTLVSFEQQCAGYGGATLRGCVRIEL